MRAERRTRFAAPFVAIVGCSGGPRTEPVRPPDPIATVPLDAAEPEPVAPPTDATTIVATPIDAWVEPPFTRPKKRPRNDFCCRNPPEPERVRVPVEGRILRVQIDGDAQIVLTGRGSNDGVEKDWQAELLNESGRPLPVRAVIDRVQQRTTVVRISGTMDPRSNLRVRLSPPVR